MIKYQNMIPTSVNFLLRSWSRSVLIFTLIPWAANFFRCLSSCRWIFLSFLAASLFIASSAEMGLPEQDWGCVLWAGLPGPFFVWSIFRHLALLFWNHTWSEMNLRYHITMSFQLNVVKFGTSKLNLIVT